jgi:hypothetical protein
MLVNGKTEGKKGGTCACSSTLPRPLLMLDPQMRDVGFYSARCAVYWNSSRFDGKLFPSCFCRESVTSVIVAMIRMTLYPFKCD